MKTIVNSNFYGEKTALIFHKGMEFSVVRYAGYLRMKRHINNNLESECVSCEILKLHLNGNFYNSYPSLEFKVDENTELELKNELVRLNAIM